MRKTTAALAAVVVLLSIAIFSELQLRSIDRVDPLGRQLLYLPTYRMLKLMSLGNEGLMADLLYVWSIQYYSQFQPVEKFLYLEKVFDLITDLDPLYFDAYRVGAMIMTLELSQPPQERARAVERLYDKGLENMPHNWELAEVAAWDAFLQLNNHELAIKFADIGAAIPGVPHRLRRVYGLWVDKEEAWTIADSIAYWEEVLAEATRWPDIVLSKNHLYDAYAKLDKSEYDPMLAAYRGRFGECAEEWQQLIDLGWIQSAPLDYVGNPYRIDPDRCVLQPVKRIRWER